MDSAFPELGDRPEDLGAAASYRLDDDQFARAASYGVAHEVAAGEFLFQEGDEDTDLILLQTATVEALLTRSSRTTSASRSGSAAPRWRRARSSRRSSSARTSGVRARRPPCGRRTACTS
jgi:CRP-like cAMP-binding protein